MLNREQILGAKDRPQQSVPVDGWGGDVMLTALSVKDRSMILGEWARLGTIQKEGGDAVAAMVEVQLRLVALSITDEDGAALFTLDDVTELAKKSRDAIGQIADAATILNKFFVRSTEDAAKN